ncbi:hypothetical protein PybrP1_001408 [[Pythium] brassicae (nom. inval.)]|nr:hypothetical protein PybrP1_001408 [[Pythium] brassicae (nom. inval.)]
MVEAVDDKGADAALRTPSLHEKLAGFYCCYVREEAPDAALDADVARAWEKVGGSRRRARERVGVLLAQTENASEAHVRHLDNAFRAKRELAMLAEGTIAVAAVGSGARGAQALAQVEHARVNNELLQECGALPVFAQHLLRSVHALRALNFQTVDVDKVDALIGELQRDMVLLFHLIVFNANKPHSAVFDRELMAIGLGAPSHVLVVIMDCLAQLNVLPGFPIKRLLLLAYEWLSAVLGDFAALSALKRLRRARNAMDTTLLEDEARGLLPCKTFKAYAELPAAALDPQDPFLLQKKKFAKLREAIHDKYRHRPHHELACQPSSDPQLATAPLRELDDEWQARCETLYQHFLPRSRDFASLLSTLVTTSCGSALNARDKKTFFSRRPPSSDPNDYNGSGYGGGGSAMDFHGAENDNQFWRWILREKAIVLDVASLLILLLFKHFRASHVYKGEYFLQFFLEANLLATLTKFMNKDIATYLQISRQDADDFRSSGFLALEKELERLNIRFDDDMSEFSVQSTRTLTTALRILQKLTKRKPNIIKNALCRSSSIVWLKRVVSLRIPLPRLYALKLVKSQAKYLGHQWMRKYTCVGLLTDVYLYVRPELDDDWLRYEEEDLNKPSSQDSVERLIFGEMQAYHHKYYWDSLASKKALLPPGGSMICEARKELESDAFDADGGRLAKFYNELKLDSANFCQHYEKWLDQESLTLDANARTAALPLSFG